MKFIDKISIILGKILITYIFSGKYSQIKFMRTKKSRERMANMTLYMVLIFAVLFALFLRIKIRVKVYLEVRYGQMNYTILCILPFGIRLKIFPRKTHKKEEKSETNTKNVEETFDLKALQMILPMILEKFLRFFSGVTCTNLYWCTQFGLGQADETAKIYGILSGVKYTFVSYMMNHVKFQAEPYICITPFFFDKHFHMTFSCMLQFRIGYAIRVALLFFKAIRNQRKESNYGSSNSRFDENCAGKSREND